MNAIMKEFDVAIVGGGPAGSSAAIRLAQTGAKVLLVEQKRFPRPKLCGEFISPECLLHFQTLGVLDAMLCAGGIKLKETIFYARNGKGIAVPSEWFGTSESFALGLSREEMDARLLKRAYETGAEVLEETQAINLLFDEDRVCGVRLRREGNKEFEVRAKVTIDATGRSRFLARRVEKGLGESRRNRARFVAFKTHLEGAQEAPLDQCEIYIYRGGYGGLSPVENGLFNFCFIALAEDVKKRGGDAERVMREVVFANKRAASSLNQARIVADWQAVTIERFGRGKLAPAHGLLTIGDAAAFIDPFTGSGMLLALESAKIAAEAVTKALPELVDSSAGYQSLTIEYQKQYEKTFDSRLRVCSWLRHVAFMPFLAETTIKTLSLSEKLRRRLVKATRRQTEGVSQENLST